MPETAITEAHAGPDLEAARALVLEYAETRGFPLSWQGFEQEHAGLPGEYAPPSGRLLVARLDGVPQGCVALRRIDDATCEMKRLYVRASARGHGVGRDLCERLIGEARSVGYRVMLLDTLERMEDANRLYGRSASSRPIRTGSTRCPTSCTCASTCRPRPEGRHVDDILIRPATRGDAAAIAAIYNQAVAHTTATFDTQPESADARAAWLGEHTRPQHPVLVAEIDGRVAGWSSLSSYSTRCAYDATVEISTYVDEGLQGRGLGPRLTEAVLEAGRRGGAHAVLSRICTENERSIRMARKAGFVEVGVLREVGVKFGRTLDVLMLERIL
jgi:L-amino acid N-acyltransferase YncA